MFEPIESKTGTGQLVAEAFERVLRRQGIGSFEVTKYEGRSAVPAISNCHLSVEQQKRLVSAFNREGGSDIYAVAVEPLKNMSTIYRVSSDYAGLAEFNHECSHFNYAIASMSSSAIVLCTTDDYIVFIGTPLFVSACAGVTEEQARLEFLEYANDPTWDEQSRGMLRSVGLACDMFRALPVASVVALPWSG